MTNSVLYRTDEEEFLQAESECDGTVEQEEQTPASTREREKRGKKTFFGGTLK